MDPQQSGAEPELGRTARKRRAILDAATEVFLQNGYLGASMDEVAAKAAVSKQTVYKQFADKEHLFTEIILGTTAHLLDGFRQVAADLDRAADARQALHALARALLAGLTRPDVLRLRRLVIAEADRFPHISGAWFEQGFHPSVVEMGEALRRLEDRGLLRKLPDPTLAAYQFAGLVMYKPMNQAMFAGTSAGPETEELESLAGQAVEVFLAAYG
ncbi:TetR/AcrR family transcriptional regulator [Nonomuraea sp. NPDC048826]|uniref:TetR/AcrR family transcriptional regulator n=1 Tax=Nonomuraea sp. NPDC048826 TaxID=3364347 RepID=UPI00371E0BAC